MYCSRNSIGCVYDKSLAELIPLHASFEFEVVAVLCLPPKAKETNLPRYLTCSWRGISSQTPPPHKWPMLLEDWRFYRVTISR